MDYRYYDHYYCESWQPCYIKFKGGLFLGISFFAIVALQRNFK